MTHEQITELMHRDIDGENSPVESASLRQHLAAHPDEQKQFAELQELSRMLASVPALEPSQNLKKHVMNSDAVRSYQPGRKGARSFLSIFQTTPHTSFHHNPQEGHMKQQHKLIFGGIAAVVAVVVYASLIYPWPATPDAVGTIGGVKKYHADQITDNDVKVNNGQNATIEPGTANDNSVVEHQASLFRNAPVDRQIQFFRAAPIDMQASLLKSAPLDMQARYFRLASIDMQAKFYQSAPLDMQASLLKSAPLDMQARFYRSAPIDMQASLLRSAPLDMQAKFLKAASLNMSAAAFKSAPIAKQAELFRSAPLDMQASLLKSAPLDMQASLYRSAPLDMQQQLERTVSLDAKQR